MASPTNSLADRIREFALRTFIQPAIGSNKHEITVRAGDVHSAMRLRDRMPAVCSALESRKFEELCGLKLTQRRGPHRGANVFLTFENQKSTPKPESPSPATTQKAQPKAVQQPMKGRTVPTDPDALYLVACVKTKRKSKAPAKDLYISSLFTKSRRYIELKGGRWRILSAKHGLVDPDKVIGPYELTLNKMGIADRREWAAGILVALSRVDPQPKQIVMLAGTKYREHLIPELQQKGIEVSVPMEGLAFGEQLSWLDAQ